LLESYTENKFRANYAQIEGVELNSKFVKIIFSSFTVNEICLQSPPGRTQNPTVCHRHLAKHCSISCYKFYRRCVPFHDHSRKFSRPWRIKYLQFQFMPAAADVSDITRHQLDNILK